MTSLTFQTIFDLHDELLVDWLSLYETTFPPEERLLVSTFVRTLQRKEQGEKLHVEMLAAIDPERNLVGLAFYKSYPETSTIVLWYLATHAAQRSRGFGSQIYQEITHRCRILECHAMVFEVEIPENARSPEQKKLAERRVQFYKRNGAKLLTGIHYLQSVGSHQPVTPMHLMFHPLKKIDSHEAYQIAKKVFGDSITQSGNLAFE
jgi:GNAT superfamily N-acetyltransferase